MSGLHAPVFSSRHLLATVTSRACIDPREGCSICNYWAKAGINLGQRKMQPPFGTLHWWECCCVWGHNVLSEWRGGFRLRTFVLACVMFDHDRGRGIEEAAIHTDCGSPRGASRVPLEHQRRTTRACPLPSTLSFSTKSSTHLFRSRNTLGTLTRLLQFKH